MSIPTYNLGYPPDGSSLGSTKKTIRDNLDGTFLTLGVDHINNNGQPPMSPALAGYHNVIHQATQPSVPGTISGINQLFSMVPSGGNPIPANGDTQLFTRTGMGGLSQMTGSSPNSNGYVWCSGILLQWGIQPVRTVATFPVTFPAKFNTVLIVTGSARAATANNNPSNNAWILQNSVTVTGFMIQNYSSSLGDFNWFAIGY